MKASIADGSKKASAKENETLVEATKAEIKRPMTEKAPSNILKARVILKIKNLDRAVER